MLDESEEDAPSEWEFWGCRLPSCIKERGSERIVASRFRGRLLGSEGGIFRSSVGAR